MPRTRSTAWEAEPDEAICTAAVAPSKGPATAGWRSARGPAERTSGPGSAADAVTGRAVSATMAASGDRWRKVLDMGFLSGRAREAADTKETADAPAPG